MKDKVKQELTHDYGSKGAKKKTVLEMVKKVKVSKQNIVVEQTFSFTVWTQKKQ